MFFFPLDFESSLIMKNKKIKIIFVTSLNYLIILILGFLGSILWVVLAILRWIFHKVRVLIELRRALDIGVLGVWLVVSITNTLVQAGVKEVVISDGSALPSLNCGVVSFNEDVVEICWNVLDYSFFSNLDYFFNLCNIKEIISIKNILSRSGILEG